jgi:hypothetical protein
LTAPFLLILLHLLALLQQEHFAGRGSEFVIQSGAMQRLLIIIVGLAWLAEPYIQIYRERPDVFQSMMADGQYFLKIERLIFTAPVTLIPTIVGLALIFFSRRLANWVESLGARKSQVQQVKDELEKLRRGRS